MPFVDPSNVQDPTFDEEIDVAWGDVVRDDLMALGAPPSVSVWRMTNQTIPDSLETGIAADVLDHDTHGMHSVVGGITRFTVQADWEGVYDIRVNTNWQANNLNRRRTRIHIDGPSGSRFIGSVTDQMGFGGECEQYVGRLFELTAGDYIEFLVYQDCGSALNLEPVDIACQSMTALWVRDVSVLAG